MISVSIQDIQQNPQDTTNFYLANIYQVMINQNSPIISTSPPSSPPRFSPPNHAVWVNALWFLSLAISLTCALLATLLQQWARRYLKITQSRYSPHKRARIRAFFAEGVEKCLLPWTVDALPTLLHISLFLFFAGLVVFLCNVNLTIFKLVLSWLGFCAAFYGWITCMPIIRHDSPYYTPLSLPAWQIVTGILFFSYRFLRWFNWSVRFHPDGYFHFRDLEESCRKSLAQGNQKTAEETALNSSSEIDTRSFMWTFDCLDEDHELEHFFSGVPGFRGSKFVNDPLPSLTEEEKLKLYGGLRGLLDRTFSSDLLSAPVKDRRALICAKAVDPEHTPFDLECPPSDLKHTPPAFRTLDVILSEYQHSGPVAIGIANVLRGWGNKIHEDDIFYAQFAISKIIARMQPHDDSWFMLTSDELGFSETSLRDYAAHGDDLSLLILIYLVRQQFIHFRKSSWSQKLDFSFVLATASKFDAKDTSLELQHEFCALWNHILNEAQGNDHLMASLILRRIRKVFLSLHQDTNCTPTQFSAFTDDWDSNLCELSSYPVCKVSDHRSDSTPHIHDDGLSTTRARAVRHDFNIPTFIPFLTSPDTPSSPTDYQLPVDETFTDALPLDKQISIQSSTQVIGQTTNESRRIPPTSRTPVTTCATHGSIDPSRTTQPSTSRPSPRSNTSASPPAGNTVGHIEHSRTLSVDLNVLSSLPPQVLDAVLPTGLLLLSG